MSLSSTITMSDKSRDFASKEFFFIYNYYSQTIVTINQPQINLIVDYVNAIVT